MKHMKQTTKRYVDCLTDMFKESTNDHKLSHSPTHYAHKHSVSSNTGTFLQKLGYLKKHGIGDYTWTGREPDETMALEILNYQRKYAQNLQNKKKHPKPTGTDTEERKRRSVAVTFVFDQVMEGIELAKKYGVAEDQWKDFVSDLYAYKKKK